MSVDLPQNQKTTFKLTCSGIPGGGGSLIVRDRTQRPVDALVDPRVAGRRRQFDLLDAAVGARHDARRQRNFGRLRARGGRQPVLELASACGSCTRRTAPAVAADQIAAAAARGEPEGVAAGRAFRIEAERLVRRRPAVVGRRLRLVLRQLLLGLLRRRRRRLVGRRAAAVAG